MDISHAVSLITGTLLGVGVLTLMVGGVVAWRRRREEAFDALPLAWAGAIAVQIGAFWWMLRNAAGIVSVWGLPSLLILSGMVVALLLAAILVLPLGGLAARETPTSRFERRGRWALLGVAAFNAIAIAGNVDFWQEGLLAESVRMNLALLLVPLAGFLGGRRVQGAAVAAYLVILIWGVVESAPLGY